MDIERDTGETPDIHLQASFRHLGGVFERPVPSVQTVLSGLYPVGLFEWGEAALVEGVGVRSELFEGYRVDALPGLLAGREFSDD